MEKYSAFISILSTTSVNVPTVHKVTETAPDNIITLRDIAVQWVQDEVGKNNFTDTLDDTKPLVEFAAESYVLMYADDTKTIINLYRISEQIGGWIYSAIKTATLMGYFRIVSIKEILLFKLTESSSLEKELYKIVAEKSELRNIIKELENKISCMNEAAANGYQEVFVLQEIVTEAKIRHEQIASVNIAQQVQIAKLQAKILFLEQQLNNNHVSGKVAQVVPSVDYDTVIDELRSFQISSLKKVDKPYLVIDKVAEPVNRDTVVQAFTSNHFSGIRFPNKILY